MKPIQHRSAHFPSCLLAVLTALLTFAASARADQAGNSPVKIFIMIGQSNMLGHGNISPVTTEGTLEYVVANDPGSDYQFLVDGGGDWVVRDDVWIKDQYGNATGLTAGYGSGANDSNLPPIGSNIGPELGFGHAMGGFYEEQILLVKAAWGGKSLGGDFRPPSSGWSVNPPVSEGDQGYYYNQVLDLVNDAITNLGTYFPDYNAAGGYEIAGICWHQGWNDRVNGTFSAAYETNMANFIRDIRTDLGVSNLPFVIATSAMDGNGPTTYTQVELAQRAMTDPYLTHASPPDLYPDFVGSVAVVDCRETYDGWDHAGLEFWQDAANSPANQGYHWNRNAKTYLNIGLAMADEMSTLAPSPCPSNLQASAGATSGITLNWLNWENIPTSVQVLRDGVEVVAALPGSSTSFEDTGADPGILDYELVFTMPGDPCPPLTVTFDGSITDLEAFRTGADVTLTWSNAMPYPAIKVLRNGVVIEASLAGTSESYIDTSPLPSGGVIYQVEPTTGTSTPGQAQINPYWDGGSTDIATDGDGASDGGSGTWDTTTLNWDEGTAPHVAWNNASNSTAIFGGTAGTVTISGGVTVGAVQINTANYVIAGAPLTFGKAGTIHNDATATISSDVAGGFGLSKTGNGILRMPAAAYTFTGNISVGGGTLDFSSATNDTVNRTLGGGDCPGNIDIATGATFQFWRNTGTQIFSGVISGGGNLRLAHKGTYTLSGANTYSGKTVFHGEYNGNTATLNVSSFNSVVGGTANSSLGAPTTVANGTVDIGRTGMQANAILNYTGTGETTDRVMNLVASGTSTKVVNNLGSGTLTFTEPWIGNNTLNFRVPITTDSDMILTGSLPGNPQYLEKRGNAKLSLEGPCRTWSYVHLFAGTLEVDSEIHDGGVYSGAITTGSGNGGTNFITVPAGTPIEVGMSIAHGRLADGTTILAITDINADPVVAEISSNSDGTTRTETGYIGMAGALGMANPSAGNLRWRGNATLKYGGPTNSTNRAFTIDNNFTSTWEILGGSTLEVSGGTTSTTGKITKTGGGTLLLSGVQQYNGITTVSTGTLALVGGSQASPITVASGASLGFTLGSPTTSSSSVDLTNGTVKITGAVDNASDYQLMTASSFSGTPTLDAAITDYALELQNSDTELWLVYTGVAGTPFEIWAGTGTMGPVTFGGDTNGDGVQDGIAFLLGAADPDIDATGLLPTESESGGALILTFNCLPSGDRGAAELRVAHSNTLASWTATVDQVPDADDAVADNNVTFVVDAVSEAPLNKITATIGSAAAADGKLFGRLEGTE